MYIISTDIYGFFIKQIDEIIITHNLAMSHFPGRDILLKKINLNHKNELFINLLKT